MSDTDDPCDALVPRPTNVLEYRFVASQGNSRRSVCEIVAWNETRILLVADDDRVGELPTAEPVFYIGDE